MSQHTESRIRILKLALQEAYRAGDLEAVRRLAGKIRKIIEGGDATLTQARAG